MASNFFGFNLFESLISSRNRDSGSGDVESLVSLPNSPDDALTHPPAWIRVVGARQAETTRRTEPVQIMADTERDEGSSCLSLSSSSVIVEEEDLLSGSFTASGGVTILSSVHSSTASSMPYSVSLPLASLPPFSNRQSIGQENDASIISAATTETRYEDQSILSLHNLSLVPSLADLSLRSPVVRSGDAPFQVTVEDHSSLVSIPLVPTTRHEPQELQAAFSAQNENEDALVAAARPWFSYLKSEDDWDRFSHDILDVLSAVHGEYDVADNEHLLARLIQEEEAMFWSDPCLNRSALRRRRLQRCLVIVGNAALLVAAPVLATSYASAIRFARH